MNIQPLADRVLVEPMEPAEVKKGGIIIPDTAKERPQEGKIIAVGSGRMTDDGNKINMEVSVGNKILYGKYSGSEVRVEDKDLLIMRESDILAVVQD
ncbi:MAG: co-chaperone GroES [candidate division Zixibacteria bacterium]|nr:co-chaperone GroES [candidate division Zixibacteria bacterium]